MENKILKNSGKIEETKTRKFVKNKRWENSEHGKKKKLPKNPNEKNDLKI